MLVALVLATAIGFGVGMVETGELRWESTALACAMMLCWLLVILAGCWLLIPRRSGRLFAQQRSLQHDFTVEWDTQGVTQRWTAGTIHTPWTEFNGWFETERIVAFGLNDQLYNFVPKRALNGRALDDLRLCAGAIAGDARAA